MYIKKGVFVNPFIDGGSQERGYRAGTENVASIVAMAIALEKNCKTMTEHVKHLQHLEDILVKELKASNIKFIRNGSENGLPGNINLSFLDAEGEMILHRLDLQGICISTGSACDSINTQVSHVIKAIGVSKQYAEGTIRISLGKDNTEEEVKTIAKELIKIMVA